MNEDVERVAGVFIAMDSLLERVEPSWWGAVVTDRRFPAVWDVNYARVERSQPDLRLAEVEEALLPALEVSGALNEHIVLYDPTGMDGFLGEAAGRGYEVNWDTAMSFVGAFPEDVPVHPVEEMRGTGERFWVAQRGGLVEFDVTGDDALDQMVEWERTVLLASGMKRWFVVPGGSGGFAGTGALVQSGDVGYIDNVVTFPAFRRRGIAAAVVTRVVREAREAGARHVYLISDSPSAIRIYRRLGFAEVGRIGSVYRRLRATASPSPSAPPSSRSEPPSSA